MGTKETTATTPTAGRTNKKEDMGIERIGNIRRKDWEYQKKESMELGLGFAAD